MTSIFSLNADKSRLTVVQREQITSGSVNVYKVRFSFNSDWDGLDRTAVFKSGSRTISVRLDDSGVCAIPWEITSPDSKDKMLFVGCCGTRGGETILPTIWASLGVVAEGASCCADASRPPMPSGWEQELVRKGVKLGYTIGGELGLYAGGELLSSVPIGAGGQGTGESDHRLLTGRDAEGQHPIRSISGLTEELGRIPVPVEPLTNFELEALLK